MVQVRIIGHLYSQLAIPYETAEHVSIRLAPRPYDYTSFISYDFYGVAYRCFGSATFWLVALFLVPVACAALQLTLKLLHLEYYPDVNDIGREVDKGFVDGTKPTSGDAYVAGFSLAGLFDCKRADKQVSHKDLTETMAGIDSPGRLGVQDSDQAQAAGRYNYDHAAEKSFYAPKTPKMPKKNGSA